MTDNSIYQNTEDYTPRPMIPEEPRFVSTRSFEPSIKEQKASVDLAREKREQTQHVTTVIDSKEVGNTIIRVFFRRGGDIRYLVVDLDVDWSAQRSEQPYRAYVSGATSSGRDHSTVRRQNGNTAGVSDNTDSTNRSDDGDCTELDRDTNLDSNMDTSTDMDV